MVQTETAQISDRFRYRERFPSSNIGLDAFKTFKDTIHPELLTSKGRAIVDAEHTIPLLIEKDASLRVKVIDNCGHACTFCHNEGTLVNTRQANQRVSIFLPSQGREQESSTIFSGFQVDAVEADEDHFKAEIERARDVLGVQEIHLTGGEPTQHRRLPQVVHMLTDMGMQVKMTSNGETGGRMYPALAKAGLSTVNISIFGSTPEEYAATQPGQFNATWAALKLGLSRQAIATAREEGITVKANCVMTDSSHEERITRLIGRAKEEDFNLRILNDLGGGSESIAAIYNLLGDLDAVPTSRKLVAGVSGAMTNFVLPNGQEVGFKQFRKERLDHVCTGCELDRQGKCEEGYYGIRLYKKQGVPVDQNPYMIGVCIQRMDLTKPVDEFYSSRLPDAIHNLREATHIQLTIMQNNQNLAHA